MSGEAKKLSGFLSQKEVEKYDALARFDSVVAAAEYLGLDKGTLYNWMSNVKKRYKKKRGWINATLAQQKRGGCLKNLLKDKKQMKPPEDDELFTHASSSRMIVEPLEDAMKIIEDQRWH